MAQARQESVESAVRERRTIKELVGDRARFLGEYRVTNHVKADQIGEIRIDGTRYKAPAATFFKDKGELLMTLEGDVVKKAYNVLLYDSFIVIEVAPRTQETNFLVLVPNFETKTGSYVVSDSLRSDDLKSVSVADTVDAIKQRRAHLHLLVEAEKVLGALE
ncbi:MAG: hypothetical protein ACE5K1_08130 [Acidiferrobacterales bacterium]